jgi:hypothetical protein
MKHSSENELTKEKLRDILISGSDERSIILPETGKNKYFIDPVDHEGLLCRGSCTCNFLNEPSEEAVRKTYQVYQAKGYETVLSHQLERLYALLSKNYFNEYDILIAPSGSDLAYIPLLIADILHHGKKITSIVTCPEELGSGSRLAMMGQYFYQKNQFGEEVQKGAQAFKHLKIRLHSFSARKKNGEIANYDEDILTLMRNSKDEAILGHLVVGSKSGIEDNLDIIPEAPKEVIWTVDLCQLRNSSSLIHKLLDRNCMIMITGSKFYQAPPFCGVMLIPKSISEKVAAYRGPIDQGFTRLFSRLNLPFSWSHLSTYFKPDENLGLLLRWEAAISEMEALDRIPSDVSQNMIDKWHDVVREEIARHEELELMPHQEHTNNSIISFRVKRNGTFLNYDELKELYARCCLRTHDGMFNEYNRFTIGQPVKYGERAFLRVAIGSFDIRKLIEKEDFRNDLFIIQRIVALSQEAVPHV